MLVSACGGFFSFFFFWSFASLQIIRLCFFGYQNKKLMKLKKKKKKKKKNKKLMSLLNSNLDGQVCFGEAIHAQEPCLLLFLVKKFLLTLISSEVRKTACS